MEISTCRVMAALLVLFVAVAQSSYLALPRLGRRSGYIAFPRLGRAGTARRAYIALPRMGRSGGDVTEPECCMPGLKSEWILEDGGRTREVNVCGAEACCEGLTEVLDQKPDGVFYTMCIPDSQNISSKLTEAADHV